MLHIVASIDYDDYINSLCEFSYYLNNHIKNSKICLLHIAESHHENIPLDDVSGYIGIDASQNLLKELTDNDQKHGQLEQQKGYELLHKAQNILHNHRINNYETLHYRGDFTEILTEIKEKIGILIMAKCKLHKKYDPQNIIYDLDQPIFIIPKQYKKFKKILLIQNEYLEYLIGKIQEYSLFSNVHIDILNNHEALKQLEEENINQITDQLNHLNISIKYVKQNTSLEDYISYNDVDLLALKKTTHSHFHDLFFGNDSLNLIEKQNISGLLL